MLRDSLLDALRAGRQKPLLDSGARCITYEDVDRLSSARASVLREFRENFVILCADDICNYVSWFFACLKESKIAVPYSDMKLTGRQTAAMLPRSIVVDGDLVRLTSSERSIAPLGDDYVYCLFTSGTTGVPKGVLVSDANLFAYVNNVLSCVPAVSEYARWSCVFRPVFDLFYHDLVLGVLAGACLQVPTFPESLDLSRYIERGCVEVWFSTPTHASNVLAKAGSKRRSIPISLFCGEALPSNICRQWSERYAGDVIVNLYGPTETTIAVTHAVWRGSDNNEAYVPIGRPMGNTQIRISDHQTLIVAGDQVARYLDTGHSGSTGFFDCGTRCFDTGDLVVDTADGLVFRGRLDSMLKIRGIRVETAELEQVALSVEGVRVCKVTPVNADGLVVSFDVIVSGDASEGAIRQAYSERYKGSLMPSKIRIVEQWETNASGKAITKSSFPQ